MFVVVRTPFFRKHPLYDGSNPACVPAGSWVFRLVEGAAHWPDLCPLTSSTPTITACSKWSSTWVCHWRGTSQSCCSVWLFTRLSPPFLVFTNCLSDEMHLYWLIEWLGVTLSDPPCPPRPLTALYVQKIVPFGKFVCHLLHTDQLANEWNCDSTVAPFIFSKQRGVWDGGEKKISRFHHYALFSLLLAIITNSYVWWGLRTATAASADYNQ